MSGGSSSSVFPVTLLAFQALCAFIWLVVGDYARGTWGGRTLGSGHGKGRINRTEHPTQWQLTRANHPSQSTSTHGPDASSNVSNTSPHAWTPTSLYGMWIGVHIMMLFGFGNLMTFLHRCEACVLACVITDGRRYYWIDP